MKIAHVKVETPEKCPFYKSWADYITHKTVETKCRFENRDTPCDWDNCPLEDVKE
jgi:hypothetical protein